MLRVGFGSKARCFCGTCCAARPPRGVCVCGQRAAHTILSHVIWAILSASARIGRSGCTSKPHGSGSQPFRRL